MTIGNRRSHPYVKGHHVYKCPVCGVPYYMKWAYEKHMRMKHEKEIKD